MVRVCLASSTRSLREVVKRQPSIGQVGLNSKARCWRRACSSSWGGGGENSRWGGGKYTLPARAGHALVPMPTDKLRQARGDDQPHGGTRQGDKGEHGAGLVFMTVEDGELNGLGRGRGGTPMSGGSLTGGRF